MVRAKRGRMSFDNAVTSHDERDFGADTLVSAGPVPSVARARARATLGTCPEPERAETWISATASDVVARAAASDGAPSFANTWTSPSEAPPRGAAPVTVNRRAGPRRSYSDLLRDVLLVLLAVDRLLSLVDVSYGRVSHGALLAAVTSVVLLAIWVPSQTRWGDKAGLGPS